MINRKLKAQIEGYLHNFPVVGLIGKKVFALPVSELDRIVNI